MTDSAPDFGLSWILELRERLERVPARRLEGKDPRVVFFVSLYVEGGQLCTVLTKAEAPHPEALGPLGFPARESEPGHDPWTVAAEAASDFLGLAPQSILRLGELDERRGFGDVRYLPCVGAIPTPESLPSREVDVVGLPILALRCPQKVEQRDIVIAGDRVRADLAHVAGHVLWGPAADILNDLLSRLGLSH